MLKVHDILNYKQSIHKEIRDSVIRLKELSKEYYNMDPNVYEYEVIKKDFLAELGFFMEKFSSVKAFKSGSHVYLEEQRKKLKSDSINIMVSEGGFKRTTAETMVYSYPYYVERVELIERLKAEFIKFELLVDHYNRVLDSIIQSTSISAKEFVQVKHS